MCPRRVGAAHAGGSVGPVRRHRPPEPHLRAGAVGRHHPPIVRQRLYYYQSASALAEHLGDTPARSRRCERRSYEGSIGTQFWAPVFSQVRNRTCNCGKHSRDDLSRQSPQRAPSSGTFRHHRRPQGGTPPSAWERDCSWSGDGCWRSPRGAMRTPAASWAPCRALSTGTQRARPRVHAPTAGVLCRDIAPFASLGWQV
jgi:hypothetical protein